jgi:hypothetical protein
VIMQRLLPEAPVASAQKTLGDDRKTCPEIHI